MTCHKQVDPIINDDYSLLMPHAHGFLNMVDSAKHVILFTRLNHITDEIDPSMT